MNKISKERLKKSMALYAVTDRRWLGEDSLADQVEASIQGGVTFLQLREKELSYEDFLEEALKIADICQKHEIPFVINDNVQIAKASGADGVHVGQSDMAMAEARQVLGEDKIIGVSVQTLEQAIGAQKAGADYLGVGAVFSTSTKNDASDVTYETLKDICANVTIPVVAIGGIHKGNLQELTGSGIDGVAVVSAIYASDDVAGASKELLEGVYDMLESEGA